MKAQMSNLFNKVMMPRQNLNNLVPIWTKTIKPILILLNSYLRRNTGLCKCNTLWSPDLEPCNFFMFPKLEIHLKKMWRTLKEMRLYVLTSYQKKRFRGASTGISMLNTKETNENICSSPKINDHMYISILFLFYNSDGEKKPQMIQFVNKKYYANWYLGKT